MENIIVDDRLSRPDPSRRSKYSIAALVAVLSVVATAAGAQSVLDNDAAAVTVRHDCTIPGTAVEFTNCFESLAAAYSWAWTVRNPTDAAPLLIDLEAGTWAETIVCNSDDGHVSLRGAGRETTIITGAPASISAVEVTNCPQLEFIDVGIVHPQWGVNWAGTGSSTWMNTDIIATGDGPGTETGTWLDNICFPGQTELKRHHFFGTRMKSVGSRAAGYPPFVYWGECSETWFYGGEIIWELGGSGPHGLHADRAAVYLTAASHFHAFGTLIKVHMGASTPSFKGNYNAIRITDEPYAASFPPSHSSSFHMHGGIINVTVDAAAPIHASGLTVTGVWASGDAMVHTLDSAFVMNLKSGVTAYRTYSDGGARIASPLLWQAGPKPPMSTTETNVIINDSDGGDPDGNDMFVETDCSPDGSCSGGNESHLMVYNRKLCSEGNPWLDTVTGRCRNDVDVPVSDAIADIEQRVSALEAAQGP